MTPKKRTLARLVIAASLASPAGATQTQFFEVATRDDFHAGTLDGVVATNFGELRLARQVEPVLKDDGAYASIDALAEGTDGTVYVGTSASGKLLAIKDDKSTELADFGEGASVGAIAVDAGGDLLIGVSGEKAQLFALRRGAARPELLVALDDAQSIWAIAITPDGTALVGTGPNGKLFRVDRRTAVASVLFDSDEDNVRCVAASNDAIFVGTDPHGLILKVDATTGKAFVVYDAPETEVSALLIDARNGQLYAATSQLVEAADDEKTAKPDVDEKAGRPGEGESPGGLPAEKPAEAPKPPATEPRPGELTRAMEAIVHAFNDAAAPAEAPAREPPASQPASAQTPNSPAGPRPNTPAAEADAEVAANGNAVYRIDSQGFVSEVFREPAMIFALARHDDELLVATGPNGTLYQVDLASEEHAAIAKLRSRQLTSLLLAGDGRAWIGSSASAELARLGASVAKTGTFTTAVLDATQIAAFGKLQVRGTVPAGTTMSVSARSGNVGDADSPLWSDWSAPVPAARFASVPTPAARYAQVRVTLGGDGKSLTPTLDSLELAYLRPNVAPRIDSVTVTSPDAAKAGDDEPAAQPTREIAWTATDANGDAMRFAVSVRAAGGAWVTIAKDLAEATYSWDTRRVADGRYEVKVGASDALANAVGTGRTASRVADAVVVDNAPPTIGDVVVKRVNGKVEVDLRVVDRGGIVGRLEYRLDDAEHWQTAVASDTLDDSPDERYAIVLPDPGQATRVLSLRGRDDNGNAAYESVTIRPDEKK